MIITIDTAAGLSTTDKNLLATILGTLPEAALKLEKRDAVEVKVDGETVEEKPAPRRRGRPAKVVDPTPEPEEPEAVEETPEAVEEDETPAVLEESPAEETTEQEYELKDAVAAATPLLSAGKAAFVKSVLKDLVVARVKELRSDKIGEFIQRLEKSEG